MTDEEKSAMLARAMGWQQCDYTGKAYADTAWVNENGLYIWYDDPYECTPTFNLYHVANMVWAWSAIEWITAPPKTLKQSEDMLNTKFAHWWDSENLWACNAADAQRAWLDKILELAIEAGLIEVDDARA